MNNRDRTTTIAHLAFPFNTITKNIFFTEMQSRQVDIYQGEKKITTQIVSNEFREFLTTKSFTFKRSTKKHLIGKNSVCGIDISIQKNYRGKEIKEILVIIEATSIEDMVEKKKKLVSGIRGIFPDIKFKESIADKFVRC